MSTITAINGTDVISTSRTTINTNFSNLNTDKIETSYLDTDTTLAANSDSKIATQKAVKAYVDTGGNVNASTTTKGIVEEATAAEITAGTAAGATGARLFINPSTLATTTYSPIKSVIAGATIAGATLPVPVYQNTTDNEFYACDGNDTAALKFQGFAVGNGTDGGAMNVQFSGIVSGFTGLTEGPYYLSDTAGTIQTTPGTNEVLVGHAISETELLIQKGKRYASGTTTFSSSTTTTITTGFRASRVRIHAFAPSDIGDLWTQLAFSNGGWTASGGNDCVYAGANEGSGSAPVGAIGVTTSAWYLPTDGGGVWHSGAVQNVTNTAFDLVNTEGTNEVTANIFWEAEGDI